MTTFEVMSSLGVHLSRHPFVLTVGIAILLRIAIRRGILRTVARRLMLYGCAAAAVVALVTYVAVVVFYATGPQYFDAAEPTMTAVCHLRCP